MKPHTLILATTLLVVSTLHAAEFHNVTCKGTYQHHQNDLKDINGIYYLTLVAMVEGSGVEDNGFSLMEIAPSGNTRIKGFRKQKTHDWDVKSQFVMNDPTTGETTGISPVTAALQSLRRLTSSQFSADLLRHKFVGEVMIGGCVCA